MTIYKDTKKLLLVLGPRFDGGGHGRSLRLGVGLPEKSNLGPTRACLSNGLWVSFRNESPFVLSVIALFFLIRNSHDVKGKSKEVFLDLGQVEKCGFLQGVQHVLNNTF